MSIKAIPLTNDPALKKLAKVSEPYFNVADRKKLREIRRDIFLFKKPFLERQKAFREHKETIEALKPLYKKIVEARNEYAKSKGPYKNFLEFSLDDKGVPKGSLDKFQKQIDGVIDGINQALPKPKNKNEFYSIYSLHDFIDEVTEEKYQLPKYIVDRLDRIIPELRSALSKIRFEDFDITHGFSETIYDKNTKTVIVRTLQNGELQTAISMAHELGHAVAYLALAKQGLEPKDRTKYWHEQQAIRMELAFINSLPENLRRAALGEILLQFAEALFEIETYTNSNQDFDKVYAQAFNRCYRESGQSKNPLYVLTGTNIFRPCIAVTQGIVHAEELLRILQL